MCLYKGLCPKISTNIMTAEEFIFKSSPYRKITGEDFKELYNELTNDNLSVSGFNPVSNVESTYHLLSYNIEMGKGPFYNQGFEPYDEDVRVMSFECGRFGDILTLLIRFNKNEGYIMKIGSFPSLRDFRKEDIKKYRKVLTFNQQQELMTAIMIYTNGVGIGSYVYLRRIFEDIVFEEAQRLIDAGLLDESKFRQMKMGEKIEAIKDELPSFLVEHHKEIYGILSAGIHELSEEFCLEYFDILYTCITLILDERLNKLKRHKAEEKASSSLGKIKAMLGA